MIMNYRNYDKRVWIFLSSWLKLLALSSFVVSCAFATAAAAASPQSELLLPASSHHVRDGHLVSTGQFVGTFASQLQANVVDALYPNVTSAELAQISLVNASHLRYLILEGAYSVDTPLNLPSLFVLQMSADTRMVPASNLTLHNVSEFTGLVQLHDVHYSAVLGGTIDATGLPASVSNYPYSRGYQAVAVKGGSFASIRGLTARANNSDTAVGINQSPHAEVAFCDIGGGPGGQGQTIGRCIWTLATSDALVHHNFVRNCSAHALDFDAYTERSAAYSNVLEDHGEEAIFVEETAKSNFVFNNTARRCASGIGIYSNAVGPVTYNLIVGNILEKNRGNAITSGGVGHVKTKVSSYNTIAYNTARGNAGHDGGIYNVHHGAVQGDAWIANTAEGSPVFGSVPVPGNASEVVVMDLKPLNTSSSFSSSSTTTSSSSSSSSSSPSSSSSSYTDNSGRIVSTSATTISSFRSPVPGPLYYKLGERDVLNSTTWPQRFKNYSIFVVEPGLHSNLLARVRQDLPHATLLAYTCMSWVYLSAPCYNATPGARTGCPGPMCADEYFNASWAVTDIKSKRPICPFNGLGTAPESAAAWVPTKASADALARFYGEKILPGFDGLYFDEDNDVFKPTWLDYIVAVTKDTEGFASDGTSIAATPARLQAQYAAWRPYFTARLRQIVGEKGLLVANVGVPHTADGALSGITVEFEHCRLDGTGSSVSGSSGLDPACLDALEGQAAATLLAGRGSMPVSGMWLTHGDMLPAKVQCAEMTQAQSVLKWLRRGDDLSDCMRETGGKSCVYC